MAIYHFNLKNISRKAGHSATAAAAYRARCRIKDERTGETYDFRRKGGLLYAGLLLPKGVKRIERERLWNMVEAAEKRRDARIAEEIVIALPCELSKREQIALARRMAQALVDHYGVAVDIAVHKPPKDGDRRNVHAHLLFTTRQVGPDGLGEKISLEWSRRRRRERGLPSVQEEVKALRETWAKLCNEALRRAGVNVRVDHRSLAERGVNRPPMIHLGAAAVHYERRTGRKSRKRRLWEASVQRVRAPKRVPEAQELERERAALEREERELRRELLLKALPELERHLETWGRACRDRREMSRKRKELEEQRCRLESELSGGRKRLEEASEALDGLQRELDGLEKRMEELARRKAELEKGLWQRLRDRRRIRELEAELVKLQGLREDLWRRRLKAEELVASIRWGELENLLWKRQRIEEELKALKSEELKAERAVSEAQKRTLKLARQIDLESSTPEALRRRLERLKAAIEPPEEAQKRERDLNRRQIENQNSRDWDKEDDLDFGPGLT